MKDIAKRSGFALVLAGILLFGIVAFLVRYFAFADRWVAFAGNPHVAEDGFLSTGKVFDRSGTLLLDAENELVYAESRSLREATLHLLGDREGNIPSRVIEHYAARLIGYDKITGTYHSNEDGELRLTISADAQKAALQALDGRKGTVGVYNYRTGEILCAVSSPSFDPDDAPEHIDDSTGTYVYRFFHAAYTPGSIFKLVTSLAALESIPDVREQTFTCDGSVTFEGEIIRCHGNHGSLSFGEALAKSCNCAFAEIACQVGAEKLSEVARRIGVTDSFEIDGISTVRGSFDLSDAGQNDLAWAGIGQYTDLVNPCQYLRFIGAIANGGSAAEPYLVTSASGGGLRDYRASTRMTRRMLDEDDARALQQMMQYNAEKIYGLRIGNLTVCAKSGTAEVGTGDNTATFAGFLLDERCPLAFIIVVEEGGAGSKTCTPIAEKVLTTCVNVLNAED